MNCSQARILLSAYRENNSQDNTTELDAHLEQCASCRAFLAQSSSIGKQIRSLPTIELHPQAYQRLMQALAQEHTHFLQHAITPVASTPDFLKPYLKEQGVVTQTNDPLAAFSTAETGPLPIIRSKRRRSFIPTQYAIIGLAAAFLLIIMTSGLVSLLVLANHGSKSSLIGPSTGASFNVPSQVSIATYETQSVYDHVVSAVANNRYVYYTAYNSDTQDWMLEQLDTKTKMSSALLPAASSSELIVLSDAHGWLVWLQLNTPKAITVKNSHAIIATSHIVTTRTWSLQALQLGVLQQTTLMTNTPITLLSGTFNDSTAPSWVHTPIQGLWFTNKALLVATVDAQGNSHLLSIQLPVTAKDKVQETQIAAAYDGHILTSPTATSNGTAILWSEEWQDSNNTFHSNIWEQQTLHTIASNIKWQPKTMTFTGLLRADGMSFQPQIVNNTLFFLSTNPNDANSSATNSSSNSASNTSGAAISVQGATPTVSSTPTATPTPNTATNATTGTSGPIPRQNATSYIPQSDATIQGVLLSLPLNGSVNSTTALTNANQASALQAGTGFLLWQNSNGYQMYDVTADSLIKVGSSASDANFLAVSGHTAVWIDSTSTGNPATSSSSSSTANIINFSIFNWPTSTQVAP